jgi:hypothetical protein
MVKHFRQASDTPFCTEPLFSIVGKTGTSHESNDILHGKLSTQDLNISKSTAGFLQELRQPDHLHHKYADIIPSLAEFSLSWQVQKERTPSCPPRHFAHIMAAVQDTTLADRFRQLEIMPLLMAHSPKSWRTCHNVLIEKKPGVYTVDKLRPIVLFDVVANHAYKHLGRCMMSLAEAHGIIAPEQAGSRKLFQASYVALNKMLTYDISRQLRKPMALCSSDAKSCYDRIVHSVASLSIQRTTLPKPPIVCVFTTIQKMKRYIRTTFGVSSDYFGGDRDFELFAIPIQTICQGNGAGPQIWALVSTPVLNLMRTEGYGFAFRCVLTNKQLAFVGYAFVDDADIGISHPKMSSPTTIAAEMQSAVTTWQEGLYATGGAPDKSVDWASWLNHCHLRPDLAILAYSTRIHKTLSYPLAVTCLNEDQCHRIQSHALRSALQKARVGRDFPNVSVFGPVKYHGKFPRSI